MRTNTVSRHNPSTRRDGVTVGHISQWVDEGMTIEDMGNPLTIEAFRERQAERPPEVPTNIERQNQRSVLRSEKASGETGPAGDTGVPEPVRDVISSTGHSLDPAIQRAMENRMDDSFSDVQIHTGSQAAAACESINARAFTVGNHIAFNSGEYDPSSPEGQHVLAHELAHVRQQTQGAVSLLPQEDVELEVDPDRSWSVRQKRLPNRSCRVMSWVFSDWVTQRYISSGIRVKNALNRPAIRSQNDCRTIRIEVSQQTRSN